MFWKFESLNSVISYIGGCQSEKSPFSARYEDGKLYYEGEWYVVLWLTYICEFVTAVHKWQWLLRLNYTPRAMFVDSYAKALIIIISSSHSFLRFHKGDHVLIESRNDTHSRYVYSSCSWCYMLLLLSNLFFLSGFQYNYLNPYPSISLIHQSVVVYLLVPSLVQFLFQVCIARHWFYSRIFCSSCQT